MAFIATGFSPLMPIATFGWFAATCIVVNYIFVITLMPPVVIINEMYFERTCTFCGGSRSEVHETSHCSNVAKEENETKQNPAVVMTPEPAGNAVESGGEQSGLEMVLASQEQSLEVLGDIIPPTDNNLGESSSLGKPLKKLPSYTDQILNLKPIRYYIKFIEWGVDMNVGSSGIQHIPVASIIIVVTLLVFAIVNVVYGLQLKPPEETEEWLPSRHMFTLAQNTLADDFLSADDISYEEITLTFGIKGIDRGNFNIYKPSKNRGKAVYDSDYNLAAPACQKVFVKMCADVQDYSCSADACKPSKKIARLNTTECFMIDFREWADLTYAEDTYAMNETTFYSRLLEYRGSQYQRHDSTQTWESQIGFIDDELKFASIYFSSSMKRFTSLQNKFDVTDRMEDFVKHVRRYDECDECDCKSLLYTGQFAFNWMRSEEGIVTGFYQGLTIAFPVALLVLLAATQNILIAFYAIATVFFIVFGVLGFTNYALGWDLGIAESIAGIIIIGFSVDYTVHLGHMFNEAEAHGQHTRTEKFEYTSEKIVGTIVGGAITTAGAGVFMFACQLTFFFKMAALIVCTIVLSYVYSLGFFMALLYLVGPERDQGNVATYFQSVAKIIHPDGTKAEPMPIPQQDDEDSGTGNGDVGIGNL